MKTLLIAMLVLAVNVSAVTIDELRDVLVSSGQFLEVGDPVQVTKRSNNPLDKTRQTYTIAAIKQSPTDSLVAIALSVRVWVAVDSSARFIGKNPIAVVSPGFYNAVVTYLSDNSILGEVVSLGVAGGVEWVREKCAWWVQADQWPGKESGCGLVRR